MSDFIHFAVSMVIICRKQDMPWREIWVFHACCFWHRLISYLQKSVKKKNIEQDETQDWAESLIDCWSMVQLLAEQRFARTGGGHGWPCDWPLSDKICSYNVWTRCQQRSTCAAERISTERGSRSRSEKFAKLLRWNCIALSMLRQVLVETKTLGDSPCIGAAA